MSVERSRRVRVDDGRSGLEVQFERLVRALGLPEPVREHRFDWCCEHPKGEHDTIAGCSVPCVCLTCTVNAYHDYHHGRQWRFDFAWPDRMVAVEVEGGIHSGGRHTRGAGFEKDCEKYSEAALLGWKVLRFTSAMLDDGRAAEFLERALEVGE